MKSIAALLLAGCVASPPPDLTWLREPVSKAPAEVDLPTVLRLAGANNLDIAYVRERVREAYARAQLAEERFWPSGGPELTFRQHQGQTQATDGAFLDVTKQQAFGGFRARLRWEVGDAIFSSLSASQRYEASRAALESAQQSIAIEAAAAYYELIRENLRARVLEQSAAVSDILAKELGIAAQAGRGFEGDVLRARVQSGASRLQLERSREGIRLATIRLASLLRLAPGTQLAAIEETPQPLNLISPDAKESELLQEAMDRRPELREAAAHVRAARHDQSAAGWAALIPDLYVEAAPGFLGTQPSSVSGTQDYAVMLSWRIGPGGLFDTGRSNLAESKLRQAEIDVERARQRISEQVLSGLAQVRAKRAQLKLAEQQVRDAEEALRMNQARQAQNIGLPLEVLQAEEALTRARLDMYTAVVDNNVAQVRTFFSVGRPLK